MTQNQAPVPEPAKPAALAENDSLRAHIQRLEKDLAEATAKLAKLEAEATALRKAAAERGRQRDRLIDRIRGRRSRRG